jgi:hypothetical protein
MRRIRRRGPLAASAAATLAFAAVALAVQTPLPVDLEAGGGDAIFDMENDLDTCFAGSETPGFGIDDGSAFGDSDAFDGGLVLWVNGVPFVDGDDEGDLVGDKLTVGPESLGAVNVRRIETALPGSPTLRTLIELKNTKKKKKTTLNLTIDSDLGSDSDTSVRETSSGDAAFTARDRWVVTSDDAADAGDPPVTEALFGKGKVTRLAHGLVGIEEECFVAGFNVTVPGKAKRYLLLFTELSDTNASAISGAAKFNKKKLSGALKSGLKKSVRKKVVNWDIAPKKKGKKK